MEDELKFESVDQLREFVTTNPIEGVVVRTPEQEQEYWNNTVQEQINNRTKELYGSFEEHIAKVTGQDRKDGEKAYDYFTRVWTDTTKSFDQTRSEYERKLEEKISAADAGNEFKKRYEALQEKYRTDRENFEGQLKEKDRAVFMTKVQSTIDKDIERIALELDKNYAPNDFTKKAVLENLRNQFQNRTVPHDVNGVLMFNDKDDKPILNEKNGQPLTGYDILKSLLPAEALKAPKTIGGMGGDGGAGHNGDDPEDLVLPETVKNLSDLVKHIQEKFPDVNRFSPEFDKIFAKNKSKVAFKL